MEATSPIVRRPKRCMLAFTPEERGRRSMERGARNATASVRTMVAPWVLLTLALGTRVQSGAGR